MHPTKKYRSSFIESIASEKQTSFIKSILFDPESSPVDGQSREFDSVRSSQFDYSRFVDRESMMTDNSSFRSPRDAEVPSSADTRDSSGFGLFKSSYSAGNYLESDGKLELM